MIRQNLHTHTFFDDGKDSPADMARAALSAGLTSLGFSGHSVLPYENDWSMTEASFREYIRSVRQTRDLLSDSLRVYIGLEWDHISSPACFSEDFDHIIGSVHHVITSGHFISVDESAECTKKALHRYYHDDALLLAESYFSQYQILAEIPEVDIIGHFDLITKFDESHHIFPTDSSRYMQAATDALDLLIRKDKIFEVNTGAMSRGYRTVPYPSVPILREIILRGGRVTVSSDAHQASAVAYGFDLAEELLQQLGCREIWELSDSGFIPIPL